MFAVRWMVKNTSFRFFTAYSDTEAKELGTIYQACNFLYLGQSSGARLEYFDPKHPERGWFSDRLFRKNSQVKKYAKELGIKWDQDWSAPDKILWDKIPLEIRTSLKQQAKDHQDRCSTRNLPRKHKYALILGVNKAETRKLTSLFEKHNPSLIGLPYPKLRGPQNLEVNTSSNTAVNIAELKSQTLTEKTLDCRPWPQKTEQEIYLSAKEAAMFLRLSVWSIYKLIQSDPTFPAHNIGVKKKFVVGQKALVEWMESTTRRRSLERQCLPSGIDLLKRKGA